MKKQKTFFGVFGVILVALLILMSFFEETNLSEEEYLIEEINFSADVSKNISDLYIYNKYEPDLYFCLGVTISNDIYVGYKQVKKVGVTTNGSEALYLTNLSIFKEPYYCLKKTEKEGKFYFGFISNNDIDSVNINGQNISVEYFNYPNNSEDFFGFWYLKEDWDYSINDFSYNQLGKSE